MYLRWAERHRFKTEIIDQQEGEQAGLKSVTVAVNGPARLRLAARRARRPPPRPDQPVRLPEPAPDDVRAGRGHARGRRRRRDRARLGRDPGRHVPLAGRRRPARQQDRLRGPADPPARPGSSSRARTSAPQTQNKEIAIQVLKARLLERELEEKEAELRALKGEHVEAGWGNQIRSYVLHPYQMVKDLRTGHETSNTGAVLDGDLDAFMQAELERLATGGEWRGRRRTRATRRRPRRPRPAARDGSTYRPGRLDDLPPAPTIWRVAIDDYIGRLDQPRLPEDLAPLRRLLAHLLAPTRTGSSSPTEPDGTDDGRRRSPRPIVRERLWFLAMLFVLPEARRAGVGPRSSWTRIAPAATRDIGSTRHVHRRRPADLATPCTPRRGMVPRIPLLACSACRRRPEAVPRAAVAASRPVAVRRGRRGRPGDGHRRGSPATRRRARPRAARRRPPGGPRLTCAARAGAACSTASPDGDAARLRLRRRRPGGSGRSPPATRRSPGAVLGHLPPRSRRAARSRCGCRAPPTRVERGAAAPASGSTAFPVLLCWDRPSPTCRRYVPISLALL